MQGACTHASGAQNPTMPTYTPPDVKKPTEIRGLLAMAGNPQDGCTVTSDWFPDHGTRRNVLALGTAGLTIIAIGALLEAQWLLGMGVWALIIAMVIELVYRP